MVTVDLKVLLICVLLIAATVLLVFLTMAVSNLIKTLKKVNVILDDVQTVTGIVDEKAKETKPVVDDLSSALVNFASGMKGKETSISSLSNLAKSLSSMVSIIKNSKQ